MAIASIKPIETTYNGYQFRSRQEARWAVLLDTLGIDYLYETEGFYLGDGVRYLPDFWLPALKLWIEVKGVMPTEDEFIKATLLAQCHGNPVAIFWGRFMLASFVEDNAIFFNNASGVFRTVRGISTLFLGEPATDTLRLDRALAAARGARFEFGANGS